MNRLDSRSIPTYGERLLSNNFSIHPVILVLHAIQILEIGPHLTGGLGHLSHLHVFELVEAKNSLPHFIIEQGIATLPLKFRQDAHAVPGNSFGALHFEQDVSQTKGQEVSLGTLQ